MRPASVPVVRSSRCRILPLTASVLLALGACGPAPEVADASVEPVNDLPNPYERIEPWASLPEGVGVIGRGRPLFREQDFLLVGTRSHTSSRTAGLGSTAR